MRRATGLAALASASALVAGCGGGTHSAATTATTRSATTTTATTVTPVRVSKTAYVARMRSLGKTLGTEMDRLYPISTGTRGSALEKATIKRLERAQGVVLHVLASVRGLQPPQSIAADQRRLEQGLAGVASELGQVVSDLRRGDIRATQTPSRLPDLTLITSATTAMEKKGYDVLGRSG